MSKTADIAERVAVRLGFPGLAEALGTLSASRLRSLLMAVMQIHSARRAPIDLLRQVERDRLFELSNVDSRALLDLIRTAYDAAAEFEAVELSPACPLGTNQVLGQIDQNNVLSSLRGAEVIADPTAALALECARRRRGDRGSAIRLTAAPRVVRLQPFDNPEFSVHFALLCMVTAGRAEPDDEFEMASLREHIDIYLRLVAALALPVAAIEVELSDMRTPKRLDKLEQRVAEPLRRRHPNVTFAATPDRKQAAAYYDGYCFRLHMTGADGVRRSQIADGGFTNWTARLLSDNKERFLGTGIGPEYLLRAF